MNNKSQPVEPVEGKKRIPPPGTMAYAQWKRRQELSGQTPETRKTGKPASQQTAQEASQKADQEAGQPAAKEPRRSASQPASSPGVSTVIATESVLTKRLKPLAGEEPTRKTTFLVTPDEAEILEELKLQLRRRFKIKTTKNDIVRAAIRLVGQDFAKNQQTSFLARKLERK